MSGPTEKRDRAVSNGVNHFMSTMNRAVATKSIVITVQPDGYTQLHTTLTEPELTRHLMRAASGDRKGAIVQ